MLELVRKNNLLYVKVLMDLRLPIEYQNIVYNKGKKEDLLLPEVIMHILAKNGNIRFWNGVKYIKLNLGQFYDIIECKKYKVKDYVEPKKEVKQQVQQPKKEAPVEQPKVEEKKEEKPVEQPKVEEVKQEQPKNEQKHYDNNKKQRHNNNKQNNQNQGGDK